MILIFQWLYGVRPVLVRRTSMRFSRDYKNTSRIYGIAVAKHVNNPGGYPLTNPLIPDGKALKLYAKTGKASGETKN